MTKKSGKKNKGGRPTKYKPKYASDAYRTQYVQHCEENKELVSLCGLAVYIEVCEDTIQEWKAVHPKFSVSLKKIKQISKQQLFNKGLLGEYNSKIAKLILSANHGVHEKAEQELTGKDGGPVEVNIVDYAGAMKP